MLAGKCIAILVEDGFEDSHLTGTLRAMEDLGARVTVVGSGSQQSYKGKRSKTRVIADVSADMVQVKDFDAIVIPGGYAPENMRLCQPMVDLVKKANEANRVIAAIGHGPQLLVSADVLKGCRLTSSPSIAVDIKNSGAEWIDAPVVKDGNIITACRTANLPKFNKAIIEALTA